MVLEVEEQLIHIKDVGDHLTVCETSLFFAADMLFHCSTESLFRDKETGEGGWQGVQRAAVIRFLFKNGIKMFRR